MSTQREQRRLATLKSRFTAAGISPRIQWGQNFLLDRNQVNYLVRLGELSASDVVLEVGAGTGFLTTALAETGCTVLAVERDEKIFAIAREEAAAFANIQLLQADILANKTQIAAGILDRLEEVLEQAAPGARLKTVSNLPYAVGTPFVANLFSSHLPWDRAVFLLQCEVVERLVAEPGSPQYGPLAITARLGGEVELARKVPPQVFWPRPKVTSAVATVRFSSMGQRLEIPWTALRRVMQAVFSARRKTVKNALRNLAPAGRIEAILEQNGIHPEVRGEELLPAQFRLLARALA